MAVLVCFLKTKKMKHPGGTFKFKILLRQFEWPLYQWYPYFYFSTITGVSSSRLYSSKGIKIGIGDRKYLRKVLFFRMLKSYLPELHASDGQSASKEESCHSPTFPLNDQNKKSGQYSSLLLALHQSIIMPNWWNTCKMSFRRTTVSWQSSSNTFIKKALHSSRQATSLILEQSLLRAKLFSLFWKNVHSECEKKGMGIQREPTK